VSTIFCRQLPARLAHSVLAPALEGSSPTPGMPEIAEAQELLEELEDGNSQPIVGVRPAKG